MKTIIRSHLVLAIATAFLIAACGGGEVVKITTVPKGLYSGLPKEELAKLDEIKKTRGDKRIDKSLKDVIEETPRFSVAASE